LSSRLLSRNVKVKIYSTIILTVVLYGCETWSLELRKDHRLRVFENRDLISIFGPKTDEAGLRGEWWKLHNGELHHFYSSPISLGTSKQGEWGERSIWHTWEMTERCTRFRCESLW
jgi:hypothetical protein